MSSAIQQTYEELKEHYSHAQVMLGAKNLMMIDMMVSMPRGAFDQRMKDIDILTLKIHDYLSADYVMDRLESCLTDQRLKADSWGVWDTANLREMHKIYRSCAALPQDLYSRLIHLQSAGRHIQTRALKSNDRKAAHQHLDKCINVLRDVAARKQEEFQTPSKYGGLLTGLIDDLSEKDVAVLNDDIMTLLHKPGTRRKPSWGKNIEQPASPLSKRDIMWLGTLLLQQFGFDFQNGRLIVSQGQAYCGGTHVDARILVRCSDPPRFFTTLSDILYQGGRGIYMQHIPRQWANQPVGSLSGLPCVDACALLFENFIGSSQPFFAFLEKEIKTLPSDPGDGIYSALNLTKMKNELFEKHKSSDSTRNLNDLLLNAIITKIESDLIDRQLEMADLPERWRADIESVFDVDARQSGIDYLDITSWFTGRFGEKAAQNIAYVSASQIYASMQENIMDFDHLISAGEFDPITQWLHQKLFSKARSMPFTQLLRRASSSPRLKTGILKDFIQEKAA